MEFLYIIGVFVVAIGILWSDERSGLFGAILSGLVWPITLPIGLIVLMIQMARVNKIRRERPWELD